MQADKTKTEEIFSLFVGDEEMDDRLWMNEPFEVNGKIYATNGSILIRTDKEYCDFIVENKYNLPENLEENLPKPNMVKILKFEDSVFDEFKYYEGKNVECTNCDSKGMVIWEHKEHKKKFNCPECNGSGYIQRRKTFSYTTLVKTQGYYFNMKLFYKIVQVRKLVGEEILITYFLPSQDRLMVKIGDFEILIMTALLLDDTMENCDGILEIN
jgi:ssDNA-binding Zn-finger/Zn-ribbon topoisomerase 1